MQLNGFIITVLTGLSGSHVSVRGLVVIYLELLSALLCPVWCLGRLTIVKCAFQDPSPTLL